MAEKATEREIVQDENSEAVDNWRHPIDRVLVEPFAEAKAEPKEPAKEPEKKK